MDDKGIVLSKDQEQGVKDFNIFMHGSEQYMSIIGPAGSGKSTLVKALLDSLNRFQDVILTAPTHRAAGNLRKITGNQAQTIHSLLKCTLERNFKTGKEWLKFNDHKFNPNDYKESLIICDEASMIGADLLEYIQQVPCKVLFIGDNAQLPPVGEEVAATVDPKKCPWSVTQLTKIHRQALDNPIISLATKIRNNKDWVFSLDEDIKNGRGVFLLSRDEWEKRSINECKRSANENRVITYTNECSEAINADIREEIYGKNCSPYMPEEKMISNNKIISDKKSVIENNDEVIIREIEPDLDNDYFLRLTVKNVFTNNIIKIKVMADPKNRKKYLDGMVKKIKNGEKGFSWRGFYSEKDSIGDLRPIYSVTAHKAQGSTYNDVYIDLIEMSRCYDKSERQRLCYVAVTRASNSVYLTV